MMRQRPWIVVLAAIGVLVLGVVAVVARSGISSTPQAANPPSTPPTSTPPARAHPSPLVVKIDNVSAARPQTGLGAADVVYVEPVEGGLTRFAAVYTLTLPRVIGPVRSARETDVGLFTQYGRPTLAYSGAAPELYSLLESAPLIRATPQQAPSAYFRDTRRQAPHNLYLRPARLPDRPQVNGEPALQFGPAPVGGTQTTHRQVGYGSARYDFTWSAQAGRWLVSLDGIPLTSTESGRVSAATIVIQRIPIRTGHDVEDAAGNPSPVAVTVGSGSVDVLRNGQHYTGRWSRPTESASTRFTTATGESLPLAAGPVWILLVPM